MSDDKDNLVDFAAAVKKRVEANEPFTRKPWTHKPGACKHESGFLVDAEAHEVMCKFCEKLVDPFKAITIVAHTWDWEQTQRAMRDLKAEAKRLQDEVDKLKALKSKLTADSAVPGKYVRKELRALSDRFKRASAGYTSRGKKECAEAMGSAAHCVRELADHLVKGALEEGEV